MQLEFTRQAFATDISYSVAVTDSLLTAWSRGSDHIDWISLQDGDPLDNLSVRDRASSSDEKRFIRLEITKLAPGQPIPAPYAVAAQVLTTTSAEVHWKVPSQDATHFLIERIHPGAPGWFLLDSVPATATSYIDGGITPGATYQYRVTAQNRVLASTPSSGGTVVMPPDSDGDGIPDADEITLGTDPYLPDTDGDGLLDGEELALGTNPTSVDSDNDGKNDATDFYPTDSLRSAPLPLTHLGQLDISAYDPGQSDAWWLAINDADEAAAASLIVPSAGPEEYRAMAWKPGALKPVTSQLRVATYGGIEYEFDPSGVSPLGMLFGTAQPTNGNPPSLFSRVQSSSSPSIVDAGGPYLLQLVAHSDAGPIHGHIFRSDFDPAHPRTFTGSLNQIQMDHQLITINAVSLNGRMAGREEPIDENGNPLPLKSWLWDATLLPLPSATAQAAGINDQKDIVGGHGTSAFLFSDGVLTPFAELIPPVFRKQLTELHPTAISNRDPASDFPIIEFQAASLEGPSPGEWMLRHLRLGKDPAGEIYLSPGVVGNGQADPLTRQVPNPPIPRQVNNKGTAIAAVAANNKTIAQINPEFVWRERYGCLDYGFDPPLPGDANPGPTDGTIPGIGSDLYKVNYIYRASVATGGLGATNDGLQVWFRSKAFGENTKLVVPAASANLIDVTPKNGPLTLFQEATGGFNAPFTITSQWAGPGNAYGHETAYVELRTADKNVLLDKLEVLIFPEAQVKLAIHRVEDPVGIAANPPRTALSPLLISNANLITGLNRAFRQAGITFVLHGSSGPEPLRYDLNDDGKLESAEPGDSEFSVLKNAPVLSTGKMNLVIFRGGINKNEWYDGKQKVGGWAPTNPDTRRLIGNKIYHTTYVWQDNPTQGNEWADLIAGCAHEIGHALRLSRRASYHPGTSTFQDKYFHDWGVFPGQVYTRYKLPNGSRPLFGLMDRVVRPDNFWLRHEDWLDANEEAWTYYR